MRLWVYVPAAELNGVMVMKMVDDDGAFFISDASHYLPIWLRKQQPVQLIQPPKIKKISNIQLGHQETECRNLPSRNESTSSNHSIRDMNISFDVDTANSFQEQDNLCMSLPHSVTEHGLFCSARNHQHINSTSHQSIPMQIESNDFAAKTSILPNLLTTDLDVSMRMAKLQL